MLRLRIQLARGLLKLLKGSAFLYALNEKERSIPTNLNEMECLLDSAPHHRTYSLSHDTSSHVVISIFLPVLGFLIPHPATRFQSLTLMAANC